MNQTIHRSLSDCFTLSNGVKIPCVGFGTFKTPNGEVCVQSVKDAIRCGYRHIDTASAYGNEASVGKAIRECCSPLTRAMNPPWRPLISP